MPLGEGGFFLHPTYKSLASGENGGKTLAIMNAGPVHPRLSGIKGAGDAFHCSICHEASLWGSASLSQRQQYSG